MANSKQYLPWIFRILVSMLFLFSAYSKLYSGIAGFETQFLEPMNFIDTCNMFYISRLLIALEIAIGIALLQNNYIKTVVIPGTILLLLIFITHLTSQVLSGEEIKNCGCNGELIKMTPLEAIIKNVITIGMLVYLFFKLSNKEKGKNSWQTILLIYALSALSMFLFFPFTPCSQKVNLNNAVSVSKDNRYQEDQPTRIDTVYITQQTGTSVVVQKKDSTPFIVEPAATVSKFSSYHDFNGMKVNLDKGKKIVCLFVPGCDHCREAAKELNVLFKKPNFPPVYILFMNEETFKIPEFFSETKTNFPYHVIEDIMEFWKLLGTGATTPGVNYLWNGNIIKSYQGLDAEKFNASGMSKIIESNQFKLNR